MVSAFDEAKNLIRLNTKRNDEQFDCLYSRAEKNCRMIRGRLKTKAMC